MELDKLYTIKAGRNKATPAWPSVPLTHNGWWWKNLLKVEFNLSKGWLRKWSEPKANNDIQKVIGFSLDPFRQSIIRLGVNNGGNGKYNDGKHLMLWSYTNLKGKYTGHDGNNRIGQVLPEVWNTIYFKLDETNRPMWGLHNLQSMKYYGEYEIKKGGCIFGTCGQNMFPYYEAGLVGFGPDEDITADIKITILDQHGNPIQV